MDYALDGRFVSSWPDVSSINSTDNSIIGTNTAFLRRDVGMVTPVLLLAHYIVFISAPVMLFLLVFFLVRYMRKNPHKMEIQSLPLHGH